MCYRYFKLIISLLLFFSYPSFSQAQKTSKYQSLLWEITGNGLNKPSYLFGTMHVSNKIAFHLSDSFYYAVKSVDAVALELNPDTWQKEMINLEKGKQGYDKFTQSSHNDFLTENSFKINKYDDELRFAISSEPNMINNLLYRTYKAREDFEEDTFLDLYIYQTGKKLGKRATGVENYYETEKILMEAYVDMANEKRKDIIDYDESLYDIQTKIQDAYRKNDLDLLDSLEKKVDQSAAFREKFLYLRNEIQANSIDTILKNNSLFVGVGAAHLPGERGVIELLRKKGYTLRPIKMNNRDAKQKETIDNLKVGVNFTTQQSEDGFYEVAAPGQLYTLKEYYQQLDRRQYSDMANGTYYLVTRIRTHAAFLGKSDNEIMKDIDNMLYENIPGKIITKKNILNNGYKGYDIINKTRRGDFQRYNIFIAPSEIIVFKMGGKENYVQGKEAANFFSSIKLKQFDNINQTFSPKQGGFSIVLPQQPLAYYSLIDNERYEYEAIDKATNDAYLIFKKTINNHQILEADTFDLNMIETSFRSSDFFDKQLERKFNSFNGFTALSVTEKLKDSSLVFAKYFTKGPDYYVVAVRTKNNKKNVESFLNSFQFTPYKYGNPEKYIDTFMNFSVHTAVLPLVDKKLKQTLEDIENKNLYKYNDGWFNYKSRYFESETTGENIALNIQTYPQYFHIKDSVKFWKEELDKKIEFGDLVVYKKNPLEINKAIGYELTLRDTGSSKQVNILSLLQNNAVYNLISIGDTMGKKSIFIDSFYYSFLPINNKQTTITTEKKSNLLFKDIFSTDSLTRTKAITALSSIELDEDDIPEIIKTIDKLKITDKNYLNIKSKLISALGFIKEDAKPVIEGYLQKLYAQTSDTTIFQDAILNALVDKQTSASYNIFKNLFLQDPPVSEDTYNIFPYNLSDSLQLTKNLFPDFLQLTTLEYYRPKVLELLVKLTDSGYIKPKGYENYISTIYFDAKVEFKKQMSKDNKLIESELKKDDEVLSVYDSYGYNKNYYNKDKSSLYNDIVLLMPFYDNNDGVRVMINKLLLSKDPKVQLDFAILLLKNNKKVDDNIFVQLADKPSVRADLFEELKKINQLDKLSSQYKNQTEIAKAFILKGSDYIKIDSAVFIGKQSTSYKAKKGIVYFFKYKREKSQEWKIGISGMFPEEEKLLDIDKKFILISDAKVKDGEPILEQFQNQLKRFLFSLHKGGKYFYEDRNYNRMYMEYD